jgi:4-hydroxythreonine-4-phosphate dehydrogenase
MTASIFDGAESLPRVGITIGDAAGIGPEISLKAVAGGEFRTVCTPVFIGDLAFLRAAASKLGLEIELVESGDGSQNAASGVEVFDLKNLPEAVTTGVDAAVTGGASAEYIKTAVDLWKLGSLDAIATAPISKKAISLGGYDFPGHTEFLAELTGTREFAMSFFAEKLRVVLLSTHTSLRNAIDLVKTERLVKLIRFSSDELKTLLGREIIIAVAGLNPHASEQGMFGSEEADEIAPAIERCRREFGIEVTGPYSPDTIFLRGFAGEFDAVIACYHDQATIAVKSLSFGSSVNVTLGLPLIRTSVDHGTAFDIAGKGVADASSMKAAVKLAAELAVLRRQHAA